MKIKFVTIFICVVYLIVGALAEDEIKRGAFPFMAFIYYQDEAILGPGGGRFLQGAVLVRPTFLISSSLLSNITKDPLSKTLLARLGATVIDPKFTLNEDEEEQEQEVIQITQPAEHDNNRPWLTDICLLKTLQPFTMNAFVYFTQLSTKQDAADKTCHVLIFKKKSSTDVRILTRLFVDMLPATQDNCGENFARETMRCASVQPATDGTSVPTDFCQGNSGGPLMCDTDVIALQTYINDECKAPFLYQLLSPKKRFLDCGIDEKCGKENCQHVCNVIQKDGPPTMARTPLYSFTAESNSSAASEVKVLTEVITTVPSPTTTTKTTTTTTTITTTTEPVTFTIDTSSTWTTFISTSPNTSEPATKSWPNERDGRKMNDFEADALNRTVKVELQSVSVEGKPRNRHVRRSKANTYNIDLIVFHFAYSFLCILS